MGRHYISKKEYLQLAQIFHAATKADFQAVFTGKFEGRHSRTEKLLPRLVREGKLIAVDYGRRLVYLAPRRFRSKKINLYKLEHGLVCTRCLVATWLSNTDGQMLAEKTFRKYSIIPEWGIKYSSGKLLLFEYSTANNFRRKQLMREKMERYTDSLENIGKDFQCERAFVVFVIEATREEVLRFVLDNEPDGDLLFSDLKSFRSVKLGQQLNTPIYIWRDGQSYPLVKDEGDV